MDLANRIRSTRYYLYLVTGPRRCDRGSSPNLSITLHDTLISTSVVLRFISARLSTWCVLSSARSVHLTIIFTCQPGPDAFKVVPNSQLIVARQAFRNNSSRYTINARSSNFTEVQTLLKGRGIDLDHKRFLILQASFLICLSCLQLSNIIICVRQGEVESIAQMKPKAPSEHEDGLLEYLEDIIGTSKYKEPIEEALLEMDRLQEDRAEKLNRLRIVEREKNALEDKKKEAEDYLRLQNEHVRALSRLWQWYLWKCLINEEEFGKKIVGFRYLGFLVFFS
jgi:chromosome segregation ATPase